MSLNLAPFGRWTLREKAALRRLALLQGLPTFVYKGFPPLSNRNPSWLNRVAINHETGLPLPIYVTA
jgi:hypothetical protein